MMKPEKFPPGSTRQSQRCQIPPEKEELCGAGVKVALADWKQILGHVGPARSTDQGRRITSQEKLHICYQVQNTNTEKPALLNAQNEDICTNGN